MYHRKNRASVSSLDVVLMRRLMNQEKVCAAFQDNELIGVRVIETEPVIAIKQIVSVHEQQKEFMRQHGFETSYSADLLGTSKVGRMSIRFKAMDPQLGFLQAKVAQQIAPIATFMFSNRITDAAQETPIYKMEQSSTTITTIMVDKPGDPQRVAGYFVGIMGTENQCRRTLNILKNHGNDEVGCQKLFEASKKDIATVIPNDRNGLRALQALASHTLPASKPDMIFI